MSGHGREGRRVIVAALLANVGIAAIKLVVAALTASTAMLAEGIHSVADSGNQLLLLLGMRLSSRAPSERRPFGSGRERYFWAFMVAVLLFSVGALFSVYEGIAKLGHPEPPHSLALAFGVLGASVVLELVSFRTAFREVRRTSAGIPILRFLRESPDPEVLVVFLEDLAALVGLVLALLGIAGVAVSGSAIFDGAASIAIGLVLGAVATVLARQMKSYLIGEGAPPAVREKIVGEVRATPGVQDLIHIRTLYLGPDDLLVALKIDFDDRLGIRQVEDAINALEARVRKSVPVARKIYVEPEKRRG